MLAPIYLIYMYIHAHVDIQQLCTCFLVFFCSIIQSTKSFFESRSAMSVLNSTSFASAMNVFDLLSNQQQAQSTPTPPTDRSVPLLSLHLNMSPAAYVAVQLLQHSPPQKAAFLETSLPGQLKEVISHKSLLTAYLSEASTSVLLHTPSEAHPVSAGDGKAGCVKMAAKLKCPVVQVNLSALVSAGHSCTALPGLVSAQQQLSFNLVPPSKDAKPDFVLCDLLEAGVKDATVSVAASIATSRLDSNAILSWDYVENERDSVYTDERGHTGSEPGGGGKCNVLAVDVSVPLLWSQLAAPQCGLAQPSSGGLDLLILSQAVEAWENQVQILLQSVDAMLQSKTQRDKQILLTLISIATAKNQFLSKPSNPVLSKLAAAYRRTVWFSCSQQLWNSLNFFREVLVPVSLGRDDEEISDVLLVAAILALVSRLHSARSRGADEGLLEMKNLITSATHVDQLGFVDHVSISPPPSDTPIGLCGTDLHDSVDLCEVFSQIDLKSLAMLRKCLHPLFSAAGIKLRQQPQEVPPFKYKFSLDFTLEMREGTLFVLDYLQPSSGSAFLHTKSTATTPAIFLEQLLLHGSVEHTSELEPRSSSAIQPTLLLPGPVLAPRTKVGVLSDCCAAVETVHVVVNTPLLKLAKHVSFTGKFRRKLRKQEKLISEDEVLTPCPPPISSPTPVPVVEEKHVTKFAMTAVREISSFGGQFVPPQLTAKMVTSRVSSPDSHVKLMDYVESPRPPKTHSHVAFDSNLPRQHSSTGSGIGQGVPLVSTFQSSSSLSSVDAARPSPRENVSIFLDDATSPEDHMSTMDTYGEDTADSLHVLSSDNDEVRATTGKLEHKTHTPLTSHNAAVPTVSPQVPMQNISLSPTRGLFLPQNNLLFSVFGLLKCSRVQCELQVETTKAVLKLTDLSASVDTRNATTLCTTHDTSSAIGSAPSLSLLSEVLPTYLSITATLKNTAVRLNDRGLPESDLVQINLLPMYVSIGINNCRPSVPSYRCLLKLTALNVDVKQSAVKVHKRFQQLMPAFTNIYNEIFGEKVARLDEAYISEASVSDVTFSVENMVRLPSKMPVGFVHFSLDKTIVYLAPLPSLTLTHTVSVYIYLYIYLYLSLSLYIYLYISLYINLSIYKSL